MQHAHAGPAVLHAHAGSAAFVHIRAYAPRHCPVGISPGPPPPSRMPPAAAASCCCGRVQRDARGAMRCCPASNQGCTSHFINQKVGAQPPCCGAVLRLIKHAYGRIRGEAAGSLGANARQGLRSNPETSALALRVWIRRDA
eukprot:358478-Chlamydomonas_euryale.AAC.21